MKLLYDAGIRLYGVGARVAALRSVKARLFSRGRRDALADLGRLTDERAPGGYDYWFHAASLGEFEQARPLIEMIRNAYPTAKILLTFFSPSGYMVRRNYDKVDVVTYLPADTPANVRRFLDIARPRCAVFVKYEFWLNFLDGLRRREIPTYLISAIFRPGQVFFKPWGGTFRRRLDAYRTIYVQDQNSADLLASIGVNRVEVLGDTRFDRVYDIMKAGERFPGIEQWRGNRFTLIVGSSWGPDEDRYIPWVNAHPEVRLIIAPHEFDDKRIEAIRSRLERPATTWTETDSAKEIPAEAQTLIVNTFGKLSSIYRYADTVIVGGGFGAGIHNINEAAVYGVPVIFGPNNRKFKEASDLKRLGGGFEYHSDRDVAELLDRFMTDPAARSTAADAAGSYILTNLGATPAIFSALPKPTGE